MAHCVNRSSPEFKALAEQSNMNPIILAAKVSLWQEKNGLDNFPTIEDVYSSVEVNLSLKAVDILASQKAIDTFAKGQKNNWPIEKTLTELQIPGEQKQLILASGKTNLDDIITDLLANYSYAVEIKTATDPKSNQNYGEDIENGFRRGEFKYFKNYKFEYIKKGFGENDPQIKISREEYEQAFAKQEDKPTAYYSNLTVPGGTNYTENEIATPAITPNIKGHAQFATDKGIGWFRSDDKLGDKYSIKATDRDSGVERNMSQNMSLKDATEIAESFKDRFDNVRLVKYEEGDGNNIRRILEVQSDLFQKGRDREDLIQRKQEVYSELVKQKDILKNIANIKKYLDRIDTAINNIENDNYESSINDFSYYIKVDTINYKEVFAGNTYNNAPINTSKALEKLKSDKYRYEAQIKESELKLQTLDETLLSTNSSDNQFLQLLNKGSNWVTFFVKSIIQDSAKKGYEKVLFPSGNTASKVEGHTTLEEFKKQKEDRIKELEKQKTTLKPLEDVVSSRNMFYTQVKVFNLKKSNGYLKDGYAVYTDKLSEVLDKSIVTNDVTTNPSGVKFTYINLSEKEKEEFTISVQEQEKRIDSEINQLKQELERVEGEEGFAALKPIYNFYENTVANVLKKQGYAPKQVTDEYGNTWNEVEIVPTRERKSILLQTKEMPGSRVSTETLNALKAVAKQMGIDFQSLEEYAKAHPEIDVKGVNGLADLIKGTIAVAQGMENVATTEEIVHMATAILEQTNPRLITQLISKIDRFKIYKQVLATYSNRKEYQLSNGKPDIRKIKKEAVDKLIAELIIYNSEGSTEFPELMEERNRSMIQQWWEAILDFIRGAYSKSNIDIFNIAASNVATGNVGGTVADITREGVFFNISNEVKAKIDQYYNTVIENAKKIEGPFPEVLNSEGKVIDKRHYMYDGVRVAESVTEKVKKKFNKIFNRTEAEKLVDEQKRDWGSAGHKYIEDYILNNLIDKDGYARDQFGSQPINSKLPAGLQVKLGEFSQMLINSYPKGTRFLIEKKVINTKVKGLLASTVDFKAVYPVKKKDGTQDFKVDTLDWKFTTVDKSKEDSDLSWFKIREWIPQMGEYTTIDYNYGIKREQVGKARMVPFILNYENSIPTDKKSPLIPTSIEIGKLDSLKETNMYLLPVPTLAESTGNTQVDALVNSLQSYYEKLFKKGGSEETEFARRQNLDQLSRAIRNLHVKLNFEPLYNAADTFLKNAKLAIRDFEDLDFETATEEQIKKGLKDLLEYNRSADKFANMDEVFLSQYPKEGMTENNKKILRGLQNVSKSTERMQDSILDLLKVYSANLAAKQGIVSEENKMSVTEAEVQINKFAKTWAEGTKLSAKLIKLASNMLMNGASMVNRETSKQIKLFGELLVPLEQSARAQGKNAFDLIGKMTPSGPELIKKIDKNFLDQVKEAKEDNDKQFLMANMDMKKFNELAKNYIEKNIATIDNTTYYLDPEQNDRMRELQKKNLRNSIDINRETFTGYNDYNFSRLFNEAMIEEGHYSKEYENMAKNEAALKMWKFMTVLNERGKAIGYLQNKSISFFPLIEATTLQKFGQTSNIMGEAGDFFKGLYSTRINEEQGMSKIDPETGKVKKVIPKYFTKTDRAVNQLSTDLNKVGTLWIKALLDYESAVNMEDTLQALLAVEKAKGSLVLDESGSVQFDSSNRPIVQQENSNYQILETIVDDGLYKLEQDLSSLGNLVISNVAGKLSNTEEGKQKSAVNLKKGLGNLDTLVRALGVGLKPLIAIANTFGGNFQAYINSGGLYTFWTEFLPNEAKVSANRLSLIEKGLLDLIVPLNEDVVIEERRKLARKQGLVNYLSTWSFTDVMMSTNAFPEKKMQLANALSIIDNSMVKDGRIVNIRQYLAAQDRKTKYNMSQLERKELERTFEQRVSELKESSSLAKIAKIENDEVVIPGVNDVELAKFRTMIVEYGRKLNGQMNRDNKAGYKRDAIFNSFMMFKTWIPKLVAEHISDINKNVEIGGNWEYGRTRAFLKTWSYLGFRNIMQIRNIINGSEEGLKVLDMMLEEKKQEHYRKTGQELEITKEEFYDVMRKELTSQMKELRLLLIIMSLLMAASAAEPPEDATDLEKNRYKWWAKMLNKVSDEVMFYYDPRSFEGMTKGSVLPSLTLITKVERIFIQFKKEFGDEPDKAHPGKAIFNIIPGLSQFQTEIWPYVDPEGAKEWGIRVTPESRR